jgi:hypothetical protein
MHPTRAILWPRLLIGLLVLISAEVFSGSSVGPGLWSPWTWVVTYWLYFAHFFFFTTLAVRTGRTSLSALYLWGVLFGLYESWITKVIWFGYGGDGKLALGRLGPYGYSEISMVFLFHPVMAFLLPLAAACLLRPPLRALFPDLALLTQGGRWARGVRVYLILCFAAVLGMNSGGPVNLALNVGFLLLLLAALWLLARRGLALGDGRSLVVFGNRGFAGLCAYLLLLYGLTYVYLRPGGLPSLQIQLLTLVFYALAILGLVLNRRRPPAQEAVATVHRAEWRRVVAIFVMVIGLAFPFSLPPIKPVVSLVAGANLVLWTPLGFVLTALALIQS